MGGEQNKQERSIMRGRDEHSRIFFKYFKEFTLNDTSSLNYADAVQKALIRNKPLDEEGFFISEIYNQFLKFEEESVNSRNIFQGAYNLHKNGNRLNEYLFSLVFLTDNQEEEIIEAMRKLDRNLNTQVFNEKNELDKNALSNILCIYVDLVSRFVSDKLSYLSDHRIDYDNYTFYVYSEEIQNMFLSLYLNQRNSINVDTFLREVNPVLEQENIRRELFRLYNESQEVEKARKLKERKF